MPPNGIGWKKWAFDPFFGLTLPGQVLTNPRVQLPKIRHWIEGEPGNWISRALWLRFGIRILGVDLGFGLAWRKKVSD